MNSPSFHLAFPVDDLAKARAFYGDLLGCPEGRSSPEFEAFQDPSQVFAKSDCMTRVSLTHMPSIPTRCGPQSEIQHAGGNLAAIVRHPDACRRLTARKAHVVEHWMLIIGGFSRVYPSTVSSIIGFTRVALVLLMQNLRPRVAAPA